MIAIGSAIVANLQRSAIYRSSGPVLAIWSTRVHGRALTRLSDLPEIPGGTDPALHPLAMQPSDAFRRCDVRSSLCPQLDSSAIRQHLGDRVAKLRGVVTHGDDRIRADSTSLSQHAIARLLTC